MRAQPVTSTSSYAAPPMSLAPLEIAVVDDDELFLSTFATNLSANGYRVSTFRNPRMALKVLLAMKQLKACIVDWRMPDMDGRTVIDTLKTSGFAVPIIVVTSSLHPKTRAEAIAHGAVACIEKTQGLAVILNRIHALVGDDDNDEGDRYVLGPLELRRTSRLVLWRNRIVNLSEAEFQILALITDLAGTHVGHGELYWAVQHDLVPVAGYAEGYRMLVRAAVERIRQKFLAVDDHFDALEHRTGLGYRWRARH
ncbi:MAG: response regulator transcription factor [Rhodospirillaceae bacterium]|nr:MAG: response regulator transcription factor [Rhodospirillaceae bacterium]